MYQGNQITTFQLKGARYALDITTKELGEYIQFSSTTISTLERKGLSEFVDIDRKKINLLVRFFNDKGIHFPDQYSILNNKIQDIEKDVLTRFQIRSSRKILNITQKLLAEKISIEVNILNALERLNNTSIIAKKNLQETNKFIDYNNLIDFFKGKNILFLHNNTICNNHQTPFPSPK